MSSAIWCCSSAVRLSVCDQLGFGGVDLLLDLVQLALEGERALRAGAAAGDGDVVEGLAGGREEEGAGISSASVRAVSGSGAMKPSRSLGRMTSSDLPKPSRTRMQS